jgi:hypothetical protein
MRKPSPAVAIASVALFFSLAGTGLAASKYLITSTSQIKPSVLKDLKGKEGPAGQQGPAGAAGAAGAAGTFSTSNVTEVTGALASMCAYGGGSCDVGNSVAVCPAGATVLSGGWIGGSIPPIEATVGDNGPIGNGTEWEVIMANNTAYSTPSFTAYAICAT